MRRSSVVKLPKECTNNKAYLKILRQKTTGVMLTDFSRLFHLSTTTSKFRNPFCTNGSFSIDEAKMAAEYLSQCVNGIGSIKMNAD